MLKVFNISKPLLHKFISTPHHRFTAFRTMATNLQLSTFQIENPNELNFVLGHAHFIQVVFSFSLFLSFFLAPLDVKF